MKCFCLLLRTPSPVPELPFLPAPYRSWTRAGEKRVQDNLHAHAQTPSFSPPNRGKTIFGGTFQIRLVARQFLHKTCQWNFTSAALNDIRNVFFTTISKITSRFFDNSDSKVHALHYANYLLVRVRLSFQKLSQNRCSTCRNNTKKYFEKGLWRVLVVDKSTEHDKPHFDLFSATTSTSKKMFFIQSAKRARAEKGIARRIDASSVVWLGPSNFWLVRSVHAHASYPGLSFRPPGLSSYIGREERRVRGLD